MLTLYKKLPSDMIYADKRKKVEKDGSCKY